MRQASQINAERRNRQKTTQVLVRFYDDRREDVAALAALDTVRGDSSRAEMLRTIVDEWAVRAALRETKG